MVCNARRNNVRVVARKDFTAFFRGIDASTIRRRRANSTATADRIISEMRDGRGHAGTLRYAKEVLSFWSVL